MQELRIWQREWREENADIKKRVNSFWAKKMPGGDADDEESASRMTLAGDGSSAVGTSLANATSSKGNSSFLAHNVMSSAVYGDEPHSQAEMEGSEGAFAITSSYQKGSYDPNGSVYAKSSAQVDSQSAVSRQATLTGANGSAAAAAAGSTSMGQPSSKQINSTSGNNMSKADAKAASASMVEAAMNSAAASLVMGSGGNISNSQTNATGSKSGAATSSSKNATQSGSKSGSFGN